MKKEKKYIISIIILIIFGVGYLHFAPIDFDAGSCSGGYKKCIADKNTTTLINTFMAEKGYDEDTKYTLISSPEEIASGINWDKRIVKVNIKMQIDNKVYDINFKGKRYWIEKYNWEVESVI